MLPEFLDWFTGEFTIDFANSYWDGVPVGAQELATRGLEEIVTSIAWLKTISPRPGISVAESVDFGCIIRPEVRLVARDELRILCGRGTIVKPLEVVGCHEYDPNNKCIHLMPALFGLVDRVTIRLQDDAWEDEGDRVQNSAFFTLHLDRLPPDPNIIKERFKFLIGQVIKELSSSSCLIHSP